MGEREKGGTGEREINFDSHRKFSPTTVILTELWRENKLKSLICSHNDLEVFKLSFGAAMQIFELTKSFPKEEKYSLVDQIRRSSQSVSANIAEAFRKRRYPMWFVSKLSDAEGEAAETQVWLDFSRQCGYISGEIAGQLKSEYDFVLGKLVMMINRPDLWNPRRPP